MNIVNQFPMQWEKKYKELFPEAKWSGKPLEGHEKYLFMWCNDDTRDFINSRTKQAKYIVFVRRYEFFSNLEALDWSKVDRVIFVNDYLAKWFEHRTGVKPFVVHNGVDIGSWSPTCKGAGNKIAWVGYINQKKNLPLALQIMDGLPRDYELHIAGAVQDGQVMLYIENMAAALKVNVFFNGPIPRESMDSWLSDKNYILSTAISEGCPNNVIEGMAKGLKPIVHNWPGAKEQFGSSVFNNIKEAVWMIKEEKHTPEVYRYKAEHEFGADNYLKVKDIVDNA